MGGTIRVNGVRRDKYVQRVTAYVLQDDVLMRVLTVRETLLFSARLRLPNTFSKLQKESMVDRIITTLGLKRCQDTKIGDQTLRGISGGERRRVNIAVELLSNPSIVFLDEITTGLDGSNALSVMQSLDKLARNSNLTMVMTIHQVCGLPFFFPLHLFFSPRLQRNPKTHHLYSHERTSWTSSHDFCCLRRAGMSPTLDAPLAPSRTCRSWGTAEAASSRHRTSFVSSARLPFLHSMCGG